MCYLGEVEEDGNRYLILYYLGSNATTNIYTFTTPLLGITYSTTLYLTKEDNELNQ
jgi:hypothetical protein